MFSLEALFCHVDDFCRGFEAQWHKRLLINGARRRNRARNLCLSEIMTILIAFHQTNYRNFKYFYLNHVKQQWSAAFPFLPSYQRFIEWIPLTLMGAMRFCEVLKPRTEIGYFGMRSQRNKPSFIENMAM